MIRPPHRSQRSDLEPPYFFPSTQTRLDKMPLDLAGNKFIVNWELNTEPVYLEDIIAPHFLIVGSPRSGKTTLMELLQSSVLKDRRFPTIPLRYRAIINDPKQEQIPFLHRMGLDINRDVIITNPFDERSSAWAVSEDVKSQVEIENLASVLCPTSSIAEVDSTGGGNQAFWNNVANELLIGLLVGLKTRSKNGYWDFRDVVLAARDWNIFEKILSTTPAGKATWDGYFIHGGFELKGSCEATIRNRVRRIATTAALWSNANTTFSVKKWRQSGSVILLGYQDEAKELTTTTNYMLVRAAFQACNSQPGGDYDKLDELTWVFLDELSTFGAVPGLVDAINFASGKGLRIVISALGFSNLTRPFRDPKEAIDLKNGCHNKAILRLESFEDCEAAANQIGMSTQDNISTTYNHDGRGGSTSRSSKRDYNVPPEIFRTLPLANNNENGVHAFFTYEDGFHYSKVPGMPSLNYADIRKLLPPDVHKSLLPPAFIRRSDDHQILKPWESQDYARLDLSPPDNNTRNSGDTKSPKSKPKLRLD